MVHNTHKNNPIIQNSYNNDEQQNSYSYRYSFLQGNKWTQIKMPKHSMTEPLDPLTNPVVSLPFSFKKLSYAVVLLTFSM